jgi:uncharacterized protein YcbX
MGDVLVISGLFVHPIKGCRPVVLHAADVVRRGLAGDRRYMLVDHDGMFVTGREEPRLLLVGVEPNERGFIVSWRGRTLEIPRELQHGPRIRVTVWKSEVDGLEHAEGSRWFSEALGRPLRLVFMPDDVERQIDLDYAKPGEIVSFADAFPLLVIGEASLSELNQRLPEPVEMRRFRPNLVFHGGPPFLEDVVSHLTAGDVVLALVKPCSRCVVTTVDLETAKRGDEPLRTLASFRKRDDKVYFGMNALIERTGRLELGMQLRAERRP